MHVVTAVALLAGLAAGAAARPLIFARAVPSGEPNRRTCPSCDADYLSPGLRGRLRATTGRCPSCKAKAGPAAWLPELLTGASFAALASTGATGWIGAAQYWLLACGAALALIDLAVHRLPDVLTLPASAGTLLLVTGAELAGEPGSIWRALAGATAVTTVYFVIRAGGGDIKLAPTVGALLGWSSWSALLWGTIAGFALGAASGLILMLLGKASRKTELAFGPYMILGALAVSSLSTAT
ncbi:prepilin peptidase [Streptomyces sp. IBSNAI002]|uniref:prepilin peptidase n=1 Tax=Streptomyces sp. IBSNAI002 TaxID=3457500 RepID=UPI003FD224AD